MSQKPRGIERSKSREAQFTFSDNFQSTNPQDLDKVKLALSAG
jgi:hypothetical protein